LPRDRRVDVLGCEIDAVDIATTLERCRQAVEEGVTVQHLCVNAAKLVRMKRDPRLRAIAANCGLVNADGQSVVWASRLLGRPLPERVAGIDLMEQLLEVAEQEGYRVYLLGARAEVLVKAVARLQARYPRLNIVGYRDGYFRDEESARICDEIRVAAPQILLVAMSSPRKEYWLTAHGPSLGVPLLMGVGGALDVVAGVRSRAPRWLQKAGLEWLFRLLQEPRRLAARYMGTNAAFVWFVLRQAVTELVSTSGSAAGTRR
jgi:N-acetylglucosaminyldiphosphoundecaprenol N-acetyl-beta-D-mannosaminyltransferase